MTSSSDILRFFAGACRADGGPRGHRVPRGPHVDGPPRSGRRRRVDRPVELPAVHGGVEARARARDRQHRLSSRPPARRCPRCGSPSSSRASCPRASSTCCRARVRDRRPLVGHPKVRMVSITGDTVTGKHIAENAADTVKRLHLELGGKAPMIVFDDADPAAVGRDDQDRRLLQLRPGLHRGLPHHRQAADLRRRARRRPSACPESIKWGNPADADDLDMGSLIAQSAGRQGRGHGRPRARREGDESSSAASGRRPRLLSSSRRSSPTSTRTREIVQDEVFGPVVTSSASRTRTAIEMANDVALRARGVGVLGERRAGDEGRREARLRHRVDQRAPLPAHLGDAARRRSRSRATGRTCPSTRWRSTRASSTSA